MQMDRRVSVSIPDEQCQHQPTARPSDVGNHWSLQSREGDQVSVWLQTRPSTAGPRITSGYVDNVVCVLWMSPHSKRSFKVVRRRK
jgi:hypothetical protein